MTRPAADLTGQRILITGGMGFVGSNLARRCVDCGAAVTVYDCLNPRSGGNEYNVRGLEDRIRLVRKDILELDTLCENVVDKDIIFNCAASTSHPLSMKEPWRDLDINGRGVINLLEALRRHNSNARFVHIGTSTQLGKLLYRPADENHPEFPTDIYSANKSVSEKYVLVYVGAYGIRGTVVRLSNVFGPRACISSPDFTFNNYFLGLALQDRAITVYGDGAQLRNVIYVDDAVDALILASRNEDTIGHVLFAVGDLHYSVADIARSIVEQTGSGRVDYVPWPSQRRSTEIGDAVITNAKIKAMLDWAPRTGLAEGLAHANTYYRSCLGKYIA